MAQSPQVILEGPRWSHALWEYVLRQIFHEWRSAFLPDKCFRWNTDKIYRDVYYPKPCPHFTHQNHLPGSSISEILPYPLNQQVAGAIANVFANQHPVKISLDWPSLPSGQ